MLAFTSITVFLFRVGGWHGYYIARQLMIVYSYFFSSTKQNYIFSGNSWEKWLLIFSHKRQFHRKSIVNDDDILMVRNIFSQSFDFFFNCTRFNNRMYVDNKLYIIVNNTIHIIQQKKFISVKKNLSRSISSLSIKIPLFRLILLPQCKVHEKKTTDLFDLQRS